MWLLLELLLLFICSLKLEKMGFKLSASNLISLSSTFISLGDLVLNNLVKILLKVL